MNREKQAVNTSACSLRRRPFPALTCRDQPQIPEIDLQLTARRPVIDRSGHLLPASPAPLGGEPVQRPLRHNHPLPREQDPDLDHRHAGLDPRGDLLTAGLQLCPPRAVPVRAHRPDHRHDLPDQLIGQLLLPAPARQAGRHRGFHVPPSGLTVNAGLRGHRPLALPREPGPQHLTNLNHRHLPEHHPGDPQSLDWEDHTGMKPDKRHTAPPVQLLATGWSHAHGGKPLNLVP